MNSLNLVTLYYELLRNLQGLPSFAGKWPRTAIKYVHATTSPNGNPAHLSQTKVRTSVAHAILTLEARLLLVLLGVLFCCQRAGCSTPQLMHGVVGDGSDGHSQTTLIQLSRGIAPIFLQHYRVMHQNPCRSPDGIHRVVFPVCTSVSTMTRR